MVTDQTSQTIMLADGRRLGFALYGQLGGKPIFHFHGNPSSRLESKFFHYPALKQNAYVVGVDRPGLGLSDYKHGRKLLDWPDDVIQLADKLGFERFGIIGGSGGGPSVLACAYKIPDRITAIGVYASPRPQDQPHAASGWNWLMRAQAFVGRSFPLWVTDLTMKAYANLLRNNTAQTLSKMSEHLPLPDQEVFKNHDVIQIFIDSIREAFRSGTQGFVLDYVISMKHWGFKLEEIVKKVKLWQGEQDTAIPSAMGHYLAKAIPKCDATFFKDEGHYSLLANRAEEMLASLIKD